MLPQDIYNSQHRNIGQREVGISDGGDNKHRLICRYGCIEDVEEVVQLWKKLASMGCHNRTTKYDIQTLEILKKQIISKISEDIRNLIVVVDKWRIIAFLFGYIIVDPIRKGVIAQIDSLYVEPEYRGKGIGSQLIKYFIEDSRKRNATEVNLCVVSDNPAVKIYKKLGFRVWQLTLRMEI